MAKGPSSWPVNEPISHPLNPYHSLGCLVPLQMLKERKQTVTFSMLNKITTFNFKILNLRCIWMSCRGSL